MYDTVVLAVAVAFLIRHALERGIAASEAAGLSAAGVLIFIYPYVKTQVGLAAVLIVMIMVAQRAAAEMRLTPPARRPESALPPAAQGSIAAGQ